MVAVAVLMLLVGVVGLEPFLSRVSILAVLAGLIVFQWGWSLFRAVLFPWAFLTLMIPVPIALLNRITFPLHVLTLKVGAAALTLFAIPTVLQGDLIMLPSMALDVSIDLNSMRSLLTLLALSIILGYFVDNRRWVRSVLALASVPTLVAAVSARIIGTGILLQYWGADKAEAYFHAQWGSINLLLSLASLFVLHRVIRM